MVRRALASVLARAARAGTGTVATTATTAAALVQGRALERCSEATAGPWLPSSSPSFASAALSDGPFGDQRRGFSSSSGLSRAKKAQRLQASRRRRGKRVTPPASVPAGLKTRTPSSAQRHEEAREYDNAAAFAETPRSRSREVALGRGAGFLSSQRGETSPQQASVLDRSAVIVTREIEMFNVFLGFEQRNRYTLRDPNGQVVGYVEEEGEGFGKVIARQMLRTRRPLRASVLSPTGELLYTIYRPFYFIQSTIEIADPSGEVVGEVYQRWHLFRRNYDLYMDKMQFGEIKGNFLAWEFEVTDENSRTLALIDRNFSGFGVELFTDAGKYVIHYGGPPAASASASAASALSAQGRGSQQQSLGGSFGSSTDVGTPKFFDQRIGGGQGQSMRVGGEGFAKVTEMSKWRTNVAMQEGGEANQIEVERPLSSRERAITLAAVLSIDSDYFSRHSSHHGIGGGGGGGIFPFPWIFGGGYGGGDDAGASSEGGAPPDEDYGMDDDDGGGWFDDIDFD